MPRFAALFALTAALAASGAAHAGERGAREAYKAGRKAYDLGRFDEAIGHFERAYEARPAPAFLFNIAQAHRQLGHCKEALFFYRLYLRRDPDSKIRAEVEGRIAELETICPAPIEPAPPDDETPPTTPPAEAPWAPRTATATAATPRPPPAADTPRRWVDVALEAGVGVAYVGDLDIPVQPSFRLGVTAPISLGPATLRLGALGTLLPVPYQGGTALLSHVLGQAELALDLLRWLSVRIEAGLGLLLFSGLDAGNPFTEGGAETSGPLGMFAVRAAAGLEVPLGAGWRARLTAFSFSFSPPKEGLDGSISRLLRLEGTLGVGVSF